MADTSPDWRDTYCGRTGELDALEQAYVDVAEGRGPRLAVLLGDRGMGKTRLVQEFYRRLTTRHDPAHYWPDAALFRGNNLRVAPDVRDDPAVTAHFAQFSIAERPMPFLWWGFRLADPTDRNAAPIDLSSHRRFLEPHLTPLFFAREDAAVRRELRTLGSATGWATLYKFLAAIPVAGLVVSLLAEGAVETRNYARGLAQRQQIARRRAEARGHELAQRQAADIVEATLRDLTAVLGPSAEMDTVPVIVFVDDAQFAAPGGDEGALRLVRELWSRAHAAGWPLLLVATHWESTWLQESGAVIESFAAHFGPFMARVDPNWRPIVLRTETGLGQLVDAGLPGLHPADHALLLDKAGGNPHLLVEIIGRIQRAPAWRTPDGGLTAAARASIDRTAFDMHRMIIDRLQAPTTPDGVRSALALSAVQGNEFLCALTETAAAALGLGPVRSSLELAEHPHRYIAGTASGVAAFAQRAYRDAALAILEQQIGDPASVEAAVLEAAIALHDDPARWRALRPDERLAALGACASLGETAPGPAQRLRAAQAMAALIEDALSHRNAQDYARAAQLAARIGRGLRDGRWQAHDFELPQLDQAFRAISVWYGAPAAADIAAALFERATALVAQADSPAARRDLSVSYNRRGEVAQARGHLDDAAQAFGEALALRQALARETGTPESRRELALSHLTLGDVQRARGRLEDAARAFETAQQLCAALAGESGTPDVRGDLAASQERLGEVAHARGRLDEAERWFAQALAVHATLARETGTPKARRDLSVSHNRLGELALAQGRLEDAAQAFGHALALREALATEVGTPEARRDLALGYMNRGDVARAAGRPDEALQDFERAQHICAALARELGTPQARRDLAVSCDQLGELARVRGQPETAQHWFERALAIDEALARELGTPEARRDLSVSYNRLGELARAQGRADAAALDFGRALALREALAGELATPAARRDLALSHIKVGELAQASGRLAQAARSLECAHGLCAALAAEVGTPEARRDLALCCMRVGEIAQARGQLDAATAGFDQALALCGALARESAAPGARRDLALCCMKAGEIAQARGDLDTATGHFEQAQALCTALEQESSGPETWRDLSLSLERLGALAQARGQLEQAEASYVRAVAVHEALVAAAATRTARRSLAHGYERLGDIAHAAGRPDAAQAWLAKALTVAESLAREELAHAAPPGETQGAHGGADAA